MNAGHFLPGSGSRRFPYWLAVGAVVAALLSLGCAASAALQDPSTLESALAARGARFFVQDTRPTACGVGAQPAVVGLKEKTPVWECLDACKPGEEYVTGVKFHDNGRRQFNPECRSFCPLEVSHRVTYVMGEDQRNAAENCQAGPVTDPVQAAALAREQAAAREDEVLTRVERALTQLEAREAHEGLRCSDRPHIAEVRRLLYGILYQPSTRRPNPPPRWRLFFEPSTGAIDRVHRAQARFSPLDAVCWSPPVLEPAAPAQSAESDLHRAARIRECQDRCNAHQRDCTKLCEAINDAACALCGRVEATCRAECR